MVFFIVLRICWRGKGGGIKKQKPLDDSYIKSYNVEEVERGKLLTNTKQAAVNKNILDATSYR